MVLQSSVENLNLQVEFPEPLELSQLLRHIHKLAVPTFGVLFYIGNIGDGMGIKSGVIKIG